jgi:nanoRNase/pAp phosphatase (c-di-AMP/oligoRNAs hydrolase)
MQRDSLNYDLNLENELYRFRKFSNELFEKILELIKEKTVILITTHENADTDAISSAIGLYFLIIRFICKKIGINGIKNAEVLIYIPTISKSARFFYEQIGISSDIEILQDLANYKQKEKSFIIVDMNSIDILEKDKNIDEIKSFIIIDHHNIPSNRPINQENIINKNIKSEKIIDSNQILSYINPNSSSCAEIISEIWKQWQIKSDFNENDGLNNLCNEKIEKNSKKISQMLLNGIFTDSANLRYSDNSIIPKIEFLINMGAKIQDIGLYRLHSFNFDERMARIKGAMRIGSTQIIKEKYVFIFTKVNAYEASVCRGLIDLGGDIVFCLSTRKKNRYRISARTSSTFQKDFKFNLGTFLEKIGLEISANGGGHKGAAGLRGDNPPSNLRELIFEKLKREIYNDKL